MRRRYSLKSLLLNEATDNDNVSAPPGIYISKTGESINVAGEQVKYVYVDAKGVIVNYSNDDEDEADKKRDRDMQLALKKAIFEKSFKLFDLTRFFETTTNDLEFEINDTAYVMFYKDGNIFIEEEGAPSGNLIPLNILDPDEEIAKAENRHFYEFEIDGDKYGVDANLGTDFLTHPYKIMGQTYATEHNAKSNTPLSLVTASPMNTPQISVNNPATSTSSKKGSKYNSSTEGIQKIIDPNAQHTSADGQWGKGTQRAWEEYVNSVEFESAMDKTYPNVADEEIENIIDDLPKKATAVTKLGYKGNSAGVLSFLQDVSDNEIIRTDVKLGDATPGNDKAAVEKVIDGSEEVDDEFVEETNEDLFGDEFKKASSENKERLVKKLIDVYKEHRSDKRKQRALKKIRRMLRKDPDALAAFEKAIEETLSESLSRGSLYRQKYWGRY